MEITIGKVNEVVIVRVLEINSVSGIKSTGRIAAEIANEHIQNGDEVIIAYGRENAPEGIRTISYKMCSNFHTKVNAFRARCFDDDGFAAYGATKKFLAWAEGYNPDLLWLHNLHGYYLNVELLFEWIKSRPKMKVNWTLHDCWPFTGHCSYYTYVKCEKWKTHCNNCIQKKEYPKSLFMDNCFSNYDRKKKAFLGVNNLTLITPSEWLANEVRDSFLNCYPVTVVNNKIDTSVFKPTPSNIKNRMGVENRKIILGVAAQWQFIKGWNDFIKLSQLIDESYIIILVGVTKSQKKSLPSNIIGVERTANVTELAELYTAADIFVNPTYEDNYPTTNLESQACGTPCITYRTGGSVESVKEENIIDVGDIEGLWRRIKDITNTEPILYKNSEGE